MRDLQRRYSQLSQQYETLLRTANTPQQVQRLRQLNEQMSKLLDDMLNHLNGANPTGDMLKTRDELTRRLTRIQRDYNGLLIATDDLETLRRIRAHESSEGRKTLTIYLFAFVALAVLLLVVIFWKGRSQTKETAAIMPTSPAVTAAFT